MQVYLHVDTQEFLKDAKGLLISQKVRDHNDMMRSKAKEESCARVSTVLSWKWQTLIEEAKRKRSTSTENNELVIPSIYQCDGGEYRPMISEVAQMLQQIEQEYQASKLGLEGLSSGNARHDFISKKTENIGKHHEHLSQLVGPEEAIALIATTIWTPVDQGALSL
jgi:hypothetical protein